MGINTLEIAIFGRFSLSLAEKFLYHLLRVSLTYKNKLHIKFNLLKWYLYKQKEY